MHQHARIACGILVLVQEATLPHSQSPAACCCYCCCCGCGCRVRTTFQMILSSSILCRFFDWGGLCNIFSLWLWQPLKKIETKAHSARRFQSPLNRVEQRVKVQDDLFECLFGPSQMSQDWVPLCSFGWILLHLWPAHQAKSHLGVSNRWGEQVGLSMVRTSLHSHIKSSILFTSLTFGWSLLLTSCMYFSFQIVLFKEAPLFLGLFASFFHVRGNFKSVFADPSTYYLKVEGTSSEHLQTSLTKSLYPY